MENVKKKKYRGQSGLIQNTCNWCSEGEERDSREDALFERIMDENSSEFMKDNKP